MRDFYTIRDKGRRIFHGEPSIIRWSMRIHRLRIVLRIEACRTVDCVLRVCHALRFELGKISNYVAAVVQALKLVVLGKAIHGVRVNVKIITRLHNGAKMLITNGVESSTVV